MFGLRFHPIHCNTRLLTDLIYNWNAYTHLSKLQNIGGGKQFFWLAQFFQNMIDLSHMLFFNTLPAQHFNTAVALELGYIFKITSFKFPLSVLRQCIGEQFYWRQNSRFFWRKGIIKLLHLFGVSIVYLVIDKPPTNAVKGAIKERHYHKCIKGFPIFRSYSKCTSSIKAKARIVIGMSVDNYRPIPQFLRFGNADAHQRRADAPPLIFRQNANGAETQHFDFAIIRCDDLCCAEYNMSRQLSLYLGHKIQLRHKGGPVAQLMDKKMLAVTSRVIHVTPKGFPGKCLHGAVVFRLFQSYCYIQYVSSYY